MYPNSITTCPLFNRHNLGWLVYVVAATMMLTAASSAQTEGFTEPFRQIELSSDESGAIAVLNVDEGRFVKSGDVVCKLDTTVQEIQVDIAKQLANSKSQVTAAEESYKKRVAITERIKTLQQKGHATDSERLRSEMELSISKARFLSAQEDSKVREIEYRRAIMQLERRTIRAPFSGVVSKVHKREGEFLSPLHPEIVTLIQIDRLLAKFNVPSSQIKAFEVGKTFQLQLVTGESVEAKVYSVGVFTEAQSGTVEVKLVIENENNELRAGEFLTLNI